MTDKDRLLKMAVSNVVCLQEEQDYADVYFNLSHIFFGKLPEDIVVHDLYANISVDAVFTLINAIHRQLIDAYNMGAHQGCLHKIIV
jgi:hypothetical protein